MKKLQTEGYLHIYFKSCNVHATDGAQYPGFGGGLDEVRESIPGRCLFGWILKSMCDRLLGRGGGRGRRRKDPHEQRPGSGKEMVPPGCGLGAHLAGPGF